MKAKNNLFDKLFLPAMWLLSIIATSLITVLLIGLSNHRKNQDIESGSYLHSQLNLLKSYEGFLDITMKDYVVTSADTTLVDYGKRLIQNIGEIRVLSPFDEIREKAGLLYTRYLAAFPTCGEEIGVLNIQTGDIVFRHNNSLHSELFRKMSVNEKKYSHLAIIEYASPDSIIAHHAVASDYTGIGGIEQTKLYYFMPKGNFDIAIYRASDDPQVQQRIIATVHNLEERKIPFDMLFDITDSTRMYCAEMVAHAVNHSMGRPVITPSGTFMGRPVITIEDCYRAPEMKLVYRRTGSNSN